MDKRKPDRCAEVPLGVECATQEPQLGTAHAVQQAQGPLAGFEIGRASCRERV